jgi:hypothetical protein
MYWYNSVQAVVEEDIAGNPIWTFTEDYDNGIGVGNVLLLSPVYDNFDYVVGNYYLLTVRFKPIGSLGNKRGIYVYVGEPGNYQDPDWCTYIAAPSAPLFKSGTLGRGKLRAVSGGYYELFVFFKLEPRVENPDWLDSMLHSWNTGIALGLIDDTGDFDYSTKVGSGVKVSKISLVEYAESTELGPEGFPLVIPAVGDTNIVPPHNYLRGTALPASSVMGLDEISFSYTTEVLDPLDPSYIDTYRPEKIYETPITVTKITAEEALSQDTIFLALGSLLEHGLTAVDIRAGSSYTLSIYVYSQDAENHVDEPGTPSELKISGGWSGEDDPFYAIFNLIGDGEVLHTSKYSAGVTKVQPPMNARGHWYRCWVSAPAAEVNEIVKIGTFSWGNPEAAQGSSISIYCPQFERGERPGLPIPTGSTNYLPDPRVKFTWDGNAWVPYPIDPYKGGDGRNRIPSRLAGGWNNEKSAAQSPFYIENRTDENNVIKDENTELLITSSDGFYGGPPEGVTGRYAMRWDLRDLGYFNIETLSTKSDGKVYFEVADRSAVTTPFGVYTKHVSLQFLRGTPDIGTYVNNLTGTVVNGPNSSKELKFTPTRGESLPVLPPSDYTASSGAVFIPRIVSNSRVRMYLGADAGYNIVVEPFQCWIFSFYVFIDSWGFSGYTSIDLQAYIEVEGRNSPIQIKDFVAYRDSETNNDWVRMFGTLDLSEEFARNLRIYVESTAFTFSNPARAIWLDGFMLEKKVGLKNEPSPWTSELGPEAIEESEIKTDQIQKGDLPGGMTLGGGEILTVQEEGEAFDGESITYKYEYRVPPRVVYLLGGITYDPILSSSISYLVAEVDNNTPTGFTPVLKLSSKLIDSASKVELTTVTTDDSYQKYNTRPTHILTKAGSPEADSQSYLYKIELNIQNLQGKYYVEGLSLPIAGSVLLEFFYDKGLGWASLGTRLYTGRSVVSELITSITGDVSFFIPGAGSGAKFGIAIQQDSGVGKTYKMPGSTIQGFAVEYYTASSGGSEVPATIAGGRGIPYFISGEKYVEGAYED